MQTAHAFMNLTLKSLNGHPKTTPFFTERLDEIEHEQPEKLARAVSSRPALVPSRQRPDQQSERIYSLD